jgi:putative transposase
VPAVQAIYTDLLRRRHPRPSAIWHLDKVFRTITGACHYLWCAMDQDGYVLDILRRGLHDRATAKTFCRKLLKGLGFEHEKRKMPAIFTQSLG